MIDIRESIAFNCRLTEDLTHAIEISNIDNAYYVGFRNGLRYALSMLTQREPCYEDTDLRGEE